MSARLTSKLLVGAIRRRAEAEGGHAMVLSRGDDMAGSILIALLDEGRTARLLERALGPDGCYGWHGTGPEAGDSGAFDDYLAKRRKFDPDIWLIELELDSAPEWLADYVGSVD